MAEIKKIATRESYGNALKELAGEGADKLVVLDLTFQQQQKQKFSKKHIRIATLTAALQKQI